MEIEAYAGDSEWEEDLARLWQRLLYLASDMDGWKPVPGHLKTPKNVAIPSATAVQKSSGADVFQMGTAVDSLTVHANDLLFGRGFGVKRLTWTR